MLNELKTRYVPRFTNQKATQSLINLPLSFDATKCKISSHFVASPEKLNFT